MLTNLNIFSLVVLPYFFGPFEDILKKTGFVEKISISY